MLSEEQKMKASKIKWEHNQSKFTSLNPDVEIKEVKSNLF
jgi:hypothetical protein